MKAVFYVEDAPVREDAVGFGMEKVNGRLAEALHDQISLVVVNERKPWSPAKRLHPAIRHRGLRVRVPGWMGGEERMRLAGHPMGAPGARLAAWKPILAGVAALRGGDCVLVPVGSDPMALGRGVQFAKILGRPYAVYAVDDTVGLARCQPEFQAWICGAAHVFALTDGLANALSERFGVTATRLSLPYPRVGAMPDMERSREILFLGNVNRLYAERLVCMKEAIDSLNKVASLGLTLRFTIAKLDEVGSLFGNTDNVVIEPIEGPGQPAKTLAGALACFAPHGFDVGRHVDTSFPSKTLEYLAWARAILCSGPENSSVVRFFIDHELPVVLTDPGQRAMESVLLRLVAENPDHHQLYRAALTLRHGYDVVRNQYLSAWK